MLAAHTALFATCTVWMHRQRGVGKVVVNTAFLSLSGMSGRGLPVHQSKSREASPTRTCRTFTEHCCQVPKLFSDQYIKKVRPICEKVRPISKKHQCSVYLQ
jgi:hypothetical protein